MASVEAEYRLGVRSLNRSSVGRSYGAGGQLSFGDVSRDLVQSALVILGVRAEEAEGLIHYVRRGRPERSSPRQPCITGTR